MPEDDIDDKYSQKVTKSEKIRAAIKDWLQIIALLVAALWAGFTFHYEKVYEPSELPSFITMNSQIEQVSKDTNFELFRITINVQNKSKVSERMVGSMFEVFGYDLKRRDFISDSAYIKSNEPKSRYFFEKKYFLLSWDKILTENSFLAPDQEFTVDKLLVVPKNHFEALKIVCFALTSKSKDLSVKWKVSSTDIRLSLIDTNAALKPVDQDIIWNVTKRIPREYDEFKICRIFTVNDFSIGLIDGAKLIQTDTAKLIQTN